MAKTNKYIDVKEFQDFKCNQEKLIEVLNHNFTGLTKSVISMSTDLKWFKKIINWQFSIFAGVLLAIVGFLIKELLSN